MEYILSFLFLALHLYNLSHPLNGILFFIISLCIVGAMFYVCYKKTKSYLCSCLLLFIHTWQESWTNIMGRSIEVSFQITWFYLVGVLILGYALVNFKKMLTNKVQPVALGFFVAFFVFMIYPLIISPSKVEGVKVLLSIAFLFIIVFISFSFQKQVPFELKDYIVKAYIFDMAVVSAFLLIPYLYYKLTGNTILNFYVLNINGSEKAVAMLLMNDTSSETVMIGASIFYILEKLNKKNWVKMLCVALLILAGIGVTTRRTSVLSLIVVLVLYVFVNYKGIVKKAVAFSGVALSVSVMLLFLERARSISSFSELIYENQRVDVYIESIKMIIKKPFGLGYDNINLLAQLGTKFIPHNTFLFWSNMGGVLFAVFFLSMMIYFVVLAKKRNLSAEFWFLIYAGIASNFVPDIFNSRLLVLPISLIFLLSDKKKEDNKPERIQAPIQ